MIETRFRSIAIGVLTVGLLACSSCASNQQDRGNAGPAKGDGSQTEDRASAGSKEPETPSITGAELVDAICDSRTTVTPTPIRIPESMRSAADATTTDGATPSTSDQPASSEPTPSESTPNESTPNESTRLGELSGIAASRATPGVWWVHNDSGNDPEIFAIDDDGRVIATVEITGADAVDWEDIAVTLGSGVAAEPATRTSGEGSRATPSKRYDRIHIADIGDNRANRDHVSIYQVDVPALKPPAGSDAVPEPQRLTASAERFDFTYPDGPRDAEALIVDPEDGPFPDDVVLYVIDKDWSMQGTSGVYQGTFDPATLGSGTSPATTAMLERIGELQYKAGSLVTAADVSGDNSAIAVRAYGIEYLYKRAPGQPLIQALATKPCVGPSVGESQGEAIGFAADNGSYVTVAEAKVPTLHRVSPSSEATQKTSSSD